MEQAFRDLRRFERAMGLDPLAADSPGVSDADMVQLRANLIQEECQETLDALMEIKAAILAGKELTIEMLAEIADGLGDLAWVVLGTAVRFGIDLPAVWKEIGRSNFSKFAPGHSFREDGKLLKPPGWTPPDVVGVMKNQESIAMKYMDGDDAARVLNEVEHLGRKDWKYDKKELWVGCNNNMQTTYVEPHAVDVAKRLAKIEDGKVIRA